MKSTILLILLFIAICATIIHAIVTESWREAPEFENWTPSAKYEQLVTRPDGEWIEPTPETTGGKGRKLNPPL